MRLQMDNTEQNVMFIPATFVRHHVLHQTHKITNCFRSSMIAKITFSCMLRKGSNQNEQNEMLCINSECEIFNFKELKISLFLWCVGERHVHSRSNSNWNASQHNILKFDF
jgi:hypothetical protein